MATAGGLITALTDTVRMGIAHGDVISISAGGGSTASPAPVSPQAFTPVREVSLQASDPVTGWGSPDARLLVPPLTRCARP